MCSFYLIMHFFGLGARSFNYAVFFSLGTPSHYALFVCTLCSRSLFAFLCSFYGLFLYTLLICSLYGLFSCALCVRLFYELFIYALFCALLIRSFSYQTKSSDKLVLLCCLQKIIVLFVV